MRVEKRILTGCGVMLSTAVGTVSAEVAAFAAINNIPEPMTLSVLGLGSVILLVRRQKK